MKPEDLTAQLAPSSGEPAGDIPRESFDGQFSLPLYDQLPKKKGLALKN